MFQRPQGFGQPSAVWKLWFQPDKQTASRLYDTLSVHNHITEETRFSNLGYWRDNPTTMDDACRALTRLVGQTARLNEQDRVLDVGFGFGDQDVFWMQEFAPREIVGFNLSYVQIEVARALVQQHQMQDRIDLRYGSATALPLDTGSIDKVIALESAMHFVTREDFFSEAYRVLRPGGMLVTADMLILAGALEKWQARLSDFFMRTFWQIPDANVYPRSEYARRLEAAGFEQVRVVSIREYVFTPLCRYLTHRMRDPEIVARLDPHYRLIGELNLRNQHVFTWYDYVIATATKPVL